MANKSKITFSRPVVAIIGTGGFGLSIARRLAPGRHVFLADANKATLESAKSAFESDGHSVTSHVLDITKYDDVYKFAELAAEAGRLDAVVNAAGLTPMEASADAVFAVDLLGTIHIIDAFEYFVGSGSAVVCIASMAGHLSGDLGSELEKHLALAPRDSVLQHDALVSTSSSSTAYGLSKKANILRVQAASKAYGAKGARIVSVSPGFISTAAGRRELDGAAGNTIRWMNENCGCNRAGTPDDVAGVVEFLVSPAASFITGNDFLVDGGATSAMKWSKGL